MGNASVRTKRGVWVLPAGIIWAVLVRGSIPVAAQSCPGDCDGNGVASVTELQTAMAIALGQAPVQRCAAVDTDGDGAVRIPELTRALFAAINGCAAAPHATAALAPAAPVVLQIGSAAGLAGQTVSIGVTLQAPSASVAGVQNDITFTASAPIAVGAGQDPACTVNPAINKNFSQFAFEPPGCIPGVTCTSMRAVILSLSNTFPIPDGSVLYTCSVAIIPAAADGVYPLHGTNAESSDPVGSPITTQIVDGNITVGIVPTQTPATADAPASLILRSARLQASPGIRLGRGLGSADVEADVNTNAPFGGLIDDIHSGGLTINLATDGQPFALGWTAGECAFHTTPNGPSIRCEADDVASHRIVTLHPTRLPNVLAIKLRVRRINLRPPLAPDAVDVSLVTATFRRPDEIGRCVVAGKNNDRKVCHEAGILPTATPTESATATATRTGTATSTSTNTGTVTRTPTATWTPTVTSIPTITRTPTPARTPTPVVVPTGPLGERVFAIDEPGALFAGTTAARSGLFTSYLNGENVADSFSSGPLVLVGGVPDASGVASLTLKNDVTLTISIYDGSWACIQLFAASSSGSIDCDGGTPYDVQGSQPTGDVGTSFTVQTGLGAPAAPGNGMLLVMEQGQAVSPGPMPDCSTITYTNPPQPFAYTTTTATAVKGSVQLAVSGEPFSCNDFATSGSGGMLAAPAPAYQAPYGDLANVFRFADEQACPLQAGKYTITSQAGGVLKVYTSQAFPFPPFGDIIADVSPGDATCLHSVVVPYPGGFTSPVYCVPALGATTLVEQTGCGIGQIASKGGADYTVTEEGDTSFTSPTCNIHQTTCPGPGPAPDSSILVRVNVGDTTPDTCSGGGTVNSIVSIPVFTTTWVAGEVPEGACPDPDGMYNPDTDFLLARFPQTLDFTTDSTTAMFKDLDGDGCFKSGVGPTTYTTGTGSSGPNGFCLGAGNPIACCTGLSKGSCTAPQGTCMDLSKLNATINECKKGDSSGKHTVCTADGDCGANGPCVIGACYKDANVHCSVDGECRECVGTHGAANPTFCASDSDCPVIMGVPTTPCVDISPCRQLQVVAATSVASGAIGTSSGPTYDLLFETVLPQAIKGPEAPLGATCSTPPLINFSGTVDRCIVSP